LNRRRARAARVRAAEEALRQPAQPEDDRGLAPIATLIAEGGHIDVIADILRKTVSALKVLAFGDALII
jgi:hypothetical protein